MKRLSGAALAMALVGCVTYDFEPVTPLLVESTTRVISVRATAAKPNVMLLLDKSGSMKDPVDPACTGAACATRIDELKAAMNTFLAQSGAVARFGLATFPRGGGADQCSAPDAVRLDIVQSNDVAAELQSHAAQIDAVIRGLGTTEAVAGGTPTAASLGYLGALPSLRDEGREDFVLLMTDGLPNCNGQNANNCTNATACRCTLAGCGVDTAAPFCTLGCLDDDASIVAVRTLAASKIRTIVVGFGKDTTGSALLDRMAQEGGQPRTCKADADCGTAGPCQSGLCRTKYYQANDGAQLAQALEDIVAGITPRPCEHTLGFVPDASAKFAVLIDGQSVAADPVNTWRFDAASSSIVLVGALCAKAEASSTLNPMDLEIRVLELPVAGN